MERPGSIISLKTCYIKDSQTFHCSGNPADLGQFHRSRNSSCSRRMVKQRRSNSVSMCTLPAIPEYPGFQDIKLSRNYSGTSACSPLFWDLGRREKSFSSQPNSFPTTTAPVCCLGGSSGGYLKGYQTTSSGFRDKPLQEYFNERLMELKNYESKRSNRKTKGFADEKQNPFLTHKGCRCRSSCSAVILIGHSKKTEETCNSENQANKIVLGYNGQEETQNVLDLRKSDYLDILTMHIVAPLEAFVQKKEIQ